MGVRVIFLRRAVETFETLTPSRKTKIGEVIESVRAERRILPEGILRARTMDGQLEVIAEVSPSLIVITEINLNPRALSR